jgi:hypothetical protein
MKRLVAGIVLSVVALAPANADPLTEARSGKMQCYRPDTVRKACLAMASYSFEPNGTITNKAVVLISPQQNVTMTTTSVVMIKNEAVCGVMRREDIEAAQIAVNGTRLSDEQAAGVRAQLVQAISNQIGKEICTTYLPAGDKLSAQVTVDGAANPLYTQDVLWVKPEDGYQVAP